MAVGILEEAKSAFMRGDFTGAAKLLERTIETAAQEYNWAIEVEAHGVLGGYLSNGGQYESAEKHLQVSVELWEQLGELSKAASIKTYLGQNASYTGNTQESARYYREAMATYVSLNDRAAIAQLHQTLVFFSKTPEEAMEHIRTGLQLAREIGERRTEAQILHLWADRSYGTDSFNDAFERLNQARSILEDLGDPITLARVLTSLGRLYRVHGHPEESIPVYRKALELQRQTVDKHGVIQTLNAIGVALDILGQDSEALAAYEESLSLAKETGSQLLIGFTMNGLASTHLN